MAGLEETLPWGPEQPPPGVTLTESLVARRNLPQPAETQSLESRSAALMALCTVRLDRENICAIGRLQSLQEVHSLYLQQNRIEKIENLSCLPRLRFLSLSGNRIRKVENLRPLQHLHFLDLSQNQIETLDPVLWEQTLQQSRPVPGSCVSLGRAALQLGLSKRVCSHIPDELPRSLRLLDLTGNECTRRDGYRELVLGALPRLLQLDAQPVPGCPEPAPLEEEEEEEGGSSSSEDEEDKALREPSSPFTAGKDFFMDLHQELAGRSRRRQREALDEHESRLELLEELQERRRLLPPPAPLGSDTCLARSAGDEGAASVTTPSPGQPRACPQAKPGMLQSPSAGAGSQQGLLRPLQGNTRATAQPGAARKQAVPTCPQHSSACGRN